MRPLLALHCALASGGAWRRVFAALPEVRGIAPDLPGHGQAAEAQGPMMDAALARVHAAAPEGPLDVVGHSYGAVVALALAVEDPARIRSLTLIEPVLFAAHPEALAWSRTAMAPFAEALARGDRATAAAHFNGLWGMGDWAALPSPVRRYITDRIHLIAATRDELERDRHGLLPRLSAGFAPLLVTRRDPPLPILRIAEGLADRMPDVRRIEIEAGQDHMLPMSAPQAVAGILQAEMARGR
ncbi:alpha/beta fold hydrolase [Jannaschia seohaensis]|uniref:Pimeloyl-ACP methyl ester carboxylesterase n=1 Tax=Jannaschia seohaensis TaxID=475081 RepID=A0A2Y9AR08_9RHOB|nr:alpha/beta fold hydrolase [Jannaschia seohaensis]PWJ19112.1 pimeloyl-ACP methyl ester carboxylesterase [Jannaschia seohaensis]SSA45748.1 Pimeloyl-ACP methyl ester carboxylesterase [Jannaschia seohaensis]